MTDAGRGRRAAAWGLAAALAAASPVGAAANPLERYAWTARPLLIFSPSESRADFQAQRAAFEADQAELADRRMPLITVVAAQVRVNGALSDLSADALRRAAGVSPGAVAVALFGKDTGLKFRRPAPVDVWDVFALIDRMPMRRREMAEQN